MAEPVKRGDKYRHIIMVAGVRRSGTFDTKKEAREWEAKLRLAAKEDPNSELLRPKHPLSVACDKYLATHTTFKRNALAWETRRFNKLIAHLPDRNIEDIRPADIAELRD
jgi:hypothetical protein